MVAASRDEESVMTVETIVTVKMVADNTRPLRRNGLSGLNGLRSAADADFHAPLAVIPQFVVKSREMWCIAKEDSSG